MGQRRVHGMIKKNRIGGRLTRILIDLPVPYNISNFLNLGSCLGLCLGLQLFTGLFLARHYNSSPEIAFDSVEHLIRRIYGLAISISPFKWSLLLLSLSFFAYFSRLYYSSYHYLQTWMLGVIIFFLTIAIAFIGYVLPGMVILHIYFLHKTGSNNPTNITRKFNLIRFHRFFSFKDVRFFFFWFFIFEVLIFLFPYVLGDPENFLFANSLSTPAHIVPEWYFLFAYAILRSIPRKLGGVISLVLAVLILIFPTLLNIRLKEKNYLRSLGGVKKIGST